jgi:hypothetical protein
LSIRIRTKAESGSRSLPEYFFPWISPGPGWRGREPEVFEADCHHQRHKEANYGTGKDHAPKSNDPINPSTVMGSHGREETINAA